tara:strand:+ start:18050 stop:18475 length:426 start_codon:yes stop_codon:yes gene_type:complete
MYEKTISSYNDCTNIESFEDFIDLIMNKTPLEIKNCNGEWVKNHLSPEHELKLIIESWKESVYRIKPQEKYVYLEDCLTKSIAWYELTEACYQKLRIQYREAADKAWNDVHSTLISISNSKTLFEAFKKLGKENFRIRKHQ